MSDKTFVFMVLEEHPYGREMLMQLMNAGHIPLAIIEETDGGERSVAIADATHAAVWTLMGITIALSLVLAAIRWLTARWGRPGGQQGV